MMPLYYLWMQYYFINHLWPYAESIPFFIMMKQYVNIAWYVKHIPYIPYTDMTLYVKHRVTDGVGLSHGVNECVYIGTKVARVSENK